MLQIRHSLEEASLDTQQFLDTLRWLEHVHAECSSALDDEAGTTIKFMQLKPHEIEVLMVEIQFL